MPTVIIGREIARRFTADQTSLEVNEGADNVRALVRTLDASYPGIGAVLNTDMAVAIDGVIYQGAMLEPTADAREVCFMPAIEGG
jgi:molybdopterin synthase sulfur carrier subunit